MKRGISFLLGTGLVASMVLTAVPVQTGSYFGVQAVYAEASVRSVETFEELLAAFDETWDADEGEMVVTLANDIEQGYEIGDYLDVSAGWTVTLDLAGHKLILRNDGPRGLRNHGTLTITGNGIITNTTDETMNEAYGLIDNYGTLVVENGTFIDYGQGGGAVLKNRPGGTMSVNGATITAYGTAGGNACLASDGALTIADGVEMVNYSTDEKHNGYYGAYALIINSGTATVGTTVGAIENPIRINGNRGAISVNSGVAVINNGEYRGGEYYGFWITNNGDASNVTINYADIYGERYGVYAAVDDGRQDLSDVGVTIEGGKYFGNTKAAVAVNASHSENSFGMAITGGVFSTAPDTSYIAENHTIYDTKDETYAYAVDGETTVNFPTTVYLSVGETYELQMSDIAERYLEAGNVLEGEKLVASFDEDTLTYTAVASGTGPANYRLHNRIGEETSGNIEITVVDSDELEIVANEETELGEEAVAEITEKLKDIVEGKVFVAEDGTESWLSEDGTLWANPEAIKEAIANGETLTIVMTNGQLPLENLDEEDQATLAQMIEEDDTVAGIWNIEFVILNESGDEVGGVVALESPITLSFEVPENLRKAAEGYTRKFYVVRYHLDRIAAGEEIDRFEAKFDGENATIENDKFSVFILTYQDEKNVETPDTGAFTAATDYAQKHGRVSVMMLAAGMMMVGYGLIVLGKEEL